MLLIKMNNENVFINYFVKIAQIYNSRVSDRQQTQVKSQLSFKHLIQVISS